RAAEIPVERARGPMLLVSGEADAMWPSTRLGELVERRAAGRVAPPGAPPRYPGAGPPSAGVPGAPAPTEVPHPVDGGWYALGGTPAANAAARADSWPQVLAFLAANVSLRRCPAASDGYGRLQLAGGLRDRGGQAAGAN